MRSTCIHPQIYDDTKLSNLLIRLTSHMNAQLDILLYILCAPQGMQEYMDLVHENSSQHLGRGLQME